MAQYCGNDEPRCYWDIWLFSLSCLLSFLAFHQARVLLNKKNKRYLQEASAVSFKEIFVGKVVANDTIDDGKN